MQLAILPAGSSNAPALVASASKFSALVDTGASCTSISRTVINAVGLLPVGKQPVGGIHGMQPANVYQFVVGITFSQGPPSLSPQPHVVLFPLMDAEFVPGQAPFDVLLGRDVLCDGVLTMTFDGRMMFSV